MNIVTTMKALRSKILIFATPVSIYF